MNLSLYKPNSKNTGCAFNFSVGQNPKGSAAFYVSAIQQYSWDNASKKANFSKNKEDSEKNINIKFNEWEIGSIISAFNNRNEYSSYHTFDENSTSIKFTPWDKPTKDGKTIPAFGMVLTRNGNQTFRLPMEPGEIETLKCFMKKYLDVFFTKNANLQSKTKTAEEKTTEEAPF